VACGVTSSKPDMSAEVAAVKAAILYADHVSLASPKAALVAHIQHLRNVTTDRDIELLVTRFLDGTVEGRQALVPLRHILSLRHPTPDQIFARSRLRRDL